MRQTVPEMLREAAETYEERNQLYGDNYRFFGDIMKALFPHSINLSSTNDYSRYALLLLMAMKLDRYAKQFDQGGHDDSLLDLAVYSQMLRELDIECRRKE